MKLLKHDHIVNSRWTLTLSVCLNLALAGAALHLGKKAIPSTPHATALRISETPISLAGASLPAASTPPASVTGITNRFVWSTIDVEDFEQLATNLREIGCPEKTVRDVVVARARRSLDKISRESEPKLSFWVAGLRRTHAIQEAERQAHLLQEKIIARLERVVGRDVFMADTKMMDRFEEQAIMRFVIGPMPEETYSKLLAAMSRFGSQRDKIEDRSGGVWLDTDESEVAQLRVRYHGALAELLSPAQWEEMIARGAMMSAAEKVCFDATDLSLTDVRQLALLRAQFTDPISDLIGNKQSEGGSLTNEQEDDLKAKERQFLGDARFAQLERARDSDFKTLFELGVDHNLSRAAATTVFELRRLTTEAVTQLRDDKSLSDAERTQLISQTEAVARRVVLQVLGAKACEQYLGGGGAWLTNAIKL